MARVNLWGINPKTKKPECFALGIDSSARTGYEAAAKEAGWTNLTIGNWSASPETEPSESSESPSSPKPRRRRSRTSGVASPAGASD